MPVSVGFDEGLKPQLKDLSADSESTGAGNSRGENFIAIELELCSSCIA